MRLVVVAAAAWLGLTLLLAWQALRGQPMLSPDGLTLAVLGALLAGVATAAGLVLRTDKTARTDQRDER